MNVALLSVVYPFLFLSLFFEVFLILTYFENESRRRRGKLTTTTFPSVAVVVPCFNEEKTVGSTVESLLKLDYPKESLEIILVDDGSIDKTREIFDSYKHHAHVRVIHKENGGKHTALNAGIASTKSEYIACLDADSFVSPHALKESIAHFDRPKIGAVTASMSVYRPKSALERMQQAEYLMGILLRHLLTTFNGLYVTPGPFTVYRRKVFDSLGAFRSAHNTEDMEIALRMQKAGWEIQNAPRARVYTKAPRTVASLLKQRVRWTTGFIRNGFDYKELFGNPRYGALGMLVLPLGAISIISAIALFFLTLFQTAHWLWNLAVQVFAVPLSYAIRIPDFDWFFVPANALIFLSVLAIVITIVFIMEGARVSKTKASLGPAIVWYIPLYSVLAPLWLIRSVSDVALGIRRGWR